jgi:isoleucyl-tRNA synthetase
MTGKKVSRRAGWDCHGLPVEQEIDKMLNIKFRDQVFEMGIDKYNDKCRSIVSRYTKEWESTITRLGRWIDFENDYKTMDITFMESVWWVFSELWKKDMVYQGFKVMPYSTGCSTVLSNSEASSNYKDVSDPAVVVAFPIVGDADFEGVSLIAWTTTPWTLPSNLALCVNPKLEYIQILDKKTNNRYVMAKSRLPQIYPAMNKKKWKPKMADELYTIEKTMLGADLKGKRYQPLFDFFAGPEAYFQVVADAYVTDDAGTGVVHQAPAFGEDDFRVCMANGIIEKGVDFPCPVDADGLFTEEVTIAKGVHVKEADNTLIADIKERGRLVQKDMLMHSYPFCWRSNTPLIYKTVTSWFIKVEEIRDQIVDHNTNVRWVPEHVGKVRFHNWLKDARDWAVSRSRFWGTPLPIWTNEDGSEMICISSIAQLEELTGTKVTDLHREFVDKLEIPSQKNPGGPPLKRVDEVFDCWFESGSMPYAQKHYPFENKEAFENGFPADFIAEGLDQTRGWFYTLMVLSTALFGKQAMNNVIVNGLVLAEDGKKMSKSLKNYPDPTIVINKYGADALRMYLINSPVVRAEELKFKEAGVLGVVKEMFLPCYNAFRFFLQNLERWESDSGRTFVPSLDTVKSTTNPTDIWISAATQGLIKFVRQEMDAYRLYTVLPALVTYVTQLTNWYVRLNRDRLKGLEGDASEAETEAEVGLQVLYDVLLDVTVVLGPFTPFLSEFFYQHLRKQQPSYVEAANGGGSANPPMRGKSDSVHFLSLPTYDASRLNAEAVETMEALQTIVEQGRNAREKRNISLRTPVKSVVAILRSPPAHVVAGLTGSLKKYILSELNAWDFQVVPEEEQHEWVTLSLTPNFKVLGKKVGKKMKAIAASVKKMTHTEAVKCLEEGKLVVEEIELDTVTELISKLSFSKEGDHWESTPSADGATVVALDTTQDDAILSAGMARELINHIQQLRKGAGLDLKDVVEVFFDEEEGVTTTEDAVKKNVATLDAKFKGSIPLPKRLAPAWSVVLRSDTVDVSGSKITVEICRPAVAVKDSLDDAVKSVLSTKEPSELKAGGSFKCEVDGKSYELTEGADYWLSSAIKAKHNSFF